MMSDDDDRWPPDGESAEQPRDIDVLRDELARGINAAVTRADGRWRTCQKRPCRRARNCQTFDQCYFDDEPVTLDPQAYAALVAELQAALRKRLAEIEARERRRASRQARAQSKLTTKREAASSKKSPNPISRPRRGSQCASRTP
jgi:hypothetical protein